MPAEDVNPPVLEYAAAAETEEIPFLSAMRMWRRVAAWSLLVSIGGAISMRLLAAVGLGGFVAASVMTLIYMTRAAAREVGVGYAVRHLLLALALTPIFFVGIFVVPLLVQSDMIKWRDVARRPAA